MTMDTSIGISDISSYSNANCTIAQDSCFFYRPCSSSIEPNSKCIIPSGKFVSRRSVQKSGATFDDIEIDDRFENSSITVAVRIRPFLQHEIKRKSRCIISMKDDETIVHQAGHSHSSLVFCYDHSFWSFEQLSPNYSSQEDIYQKIGRPLLEKSLEGFNSCLFAYGQTGSGKSYSITGTKEDPGIVPRFCGELFRRIEELQSDPDDLVSYKVEISFYEIYNEHIFDLLASQNYLKERIQLRVREHPVLGPYIEDLSTYVTTEYLDVEHWLRLGNRFRATAATGMNDKSSRSHSCFMLLVTQNRDVQGETTSKVSKINLVDLAGSERVRQLDVNSERIREGQNINKSLHTLGKVISILSENQISERKHYVPYRDSILTWLLKESLGGNSKTSMLATISPDNNSSNETLSTLRYAQQARNIVNVARVNEDPKNRLIRELQAEINRLRNLTLGVKSPGASQKVIQQLEDQLSQKERLMTETTRTWMDRLKITEQRKLEEINYLRSVGISLGVENTLPNLVNLNEDPQLSEMLIYVLKEGETSFGRKTDDSKVDVKLTGALVKESHCSIMNSANVVTIYPILDAPTYVNGHLITEPHLLHHGDRVVIGGGHFFRLNHPIEVQKRTSHSHDNTNSNHGFIYAKSELIEKQAERLQTELVEARQEERNIMMEQLLQLKESADQQLSEQRDQYEVLLKDLSEKNQVFAQDQEVYIEAQDRLEELEARIQILEDENIAQRHTIQLGEFRKQKEDEEMKTYHTRLIYELEKEKKKLEEEILKACEANEKRKEIDFSPKLSGSELVRVSMMLQEANSIAVHLGKEILFTREDIDSSENGQILSSKIGIRLYNKQNKTTTVWKLRLFESRLEHLREIYQGDIDLINSSSDPFDLEEDGWTNDPGLYTPVKPHTIYNVEHVVPNRPFPHTSANIFPTLPSTLPKSLVDILTSSTDQYSDLSLQEYGGESLPIRPNNVDITSDVLPTKESPSEVTTYMINPKKEELILHSTCVRPSIPLADPIRSFSELCIERIDGLISELKQQKKITSLEKVIIHAEILLQYTGDFNVAYFSKFNSSNISLVDSAELKRAAFNMSVAFEIVASNCEVCNFVFPGLKYDELTAELISLGLSIKQMLYLTGTESNVDVKLMLEEVTQHIDNTISILSKSLIAQFVIDQLNSKRCTRLKHDYKSQSLDCEAQQLLSHKGNLSGSICRGVLIYVKEICLQVLQSVSLSYQQSLAILLELPDSFLNSGILNAICNLLKFMHHFISAVCQASENIDRFPEKIDLFRESWPKLVWLLNTLLSIEGGILRLTNDTKEAAKNHGELEKIISQANVIAFHTMSATTSLEEIHQCGYNIIPSNVGLEYLSKNVIRAAKVLNSLAKKCNKLSNSLAIGLIK